MAPSAPPVTREEFVSLRDGAKGLMHRIPSEHKARLIELGYIEEVFGGIRLTAAGRMRIAEGWHLHPSLNREQLLSVEFD
jgi:hypothetical protein